MYINPNNNKFYADSSKQSNYLGLTPGNIDLSVEVFSSPLPAGGTFCTLLPDSKPPTGVTTVSIGINLPSF